MHSELPKGWIELEFSEAIEPRGEKVSPAVFPDYKFIGMDHVESQTTRIIGSTSASEMKSNAARFYAGDVLYGRLRPYLNKVTQPNFDGLASAEFIVFPNTSLLYSAFLKHRLNACDFVSFASHLNEGDRPRVGFDQIGKFKLWIPPANEQKRIVAKIEELFSELDKSIESLKTTREQLKVYRQSVLKSAFEGKLTVGWRKKNKVSDTWMISELGRCGKWQGGGTPSKSISSYWNNGDILWVSPKDMKSRHISDTQQKITKEGVENSPAKITGDKAVLFVIRSGIIRRILPIAIAVPGITVNQDMQALMPSEHSVEFLYWYCEANEQEIRHTCSKDGTTVESIEVAELKKFPVPVPNYDEQKEIVKLVEAQISVIENFEATIGNELQKSEALRQSILKKGFSGKLVAQDSADEPASILLERISFEKKIQSPKKKSKDKRKAA